MPTPFPGMDPYLERSPLWEEVHTGLLVEIQLHLAPLVRPAYRVGVERRTYLAVSPSNPKALIGKPDVLVIAGGGRTAPVAVLEPTSVMAPSLVVNLPAAEEIVERYLVIRDVDNNDVITVIELLSPSNKVMRAGREQYEDKRIKVLASRTNLVEIDLLRAGEPLAMWVSGGQVHSDYRIVISRAWQRPEADVYLFNVTDPIPTVPIPLRRGETEPALPLNQLVHDLYDRAGYDLAIDYSQPPEPPLADDTTPWTEALLETPSQLHSSSTTRP